MRIQEQRHLGESWLVWYLGNLLTFDEDWMRSQGIAWLFKEIGKWRFLPRLTGDQSLFYNAVLYAKVVTLFWVLPVGVFASFRWSSSTDKKAYVQFGVGFKGNGRFAILLRIQSDETSARGVTGPNYGQALGFEYGTK